MARRHLLLAIRQGGAAGQQPAANAVPASGLAARNSAPDRTRDRKRRRLRRWLRRTLKRWLPGGEPGCIRPVLSGPALSGPAPARPPRCVLAVLAGCSLLLTLPAGAAEWNEWQMAGGYRHYWSDNFNNTAFDVAKRAEHIDELRFTVGRALQLGTSTRLRFEAEAVHLAHRKYDALDRTDPGFGLSLHNKTGLGNRGWWQELFFSYRQLSPDDRLRDGDSQRYGLRLGKRFSDRWDGQFELAQFRRDGGSGLVRPVDPNRPTDVFDQRADSLRAQLNAVLGERWLLSLAYLHQRGDFESQCPTANVTQVVADEDPPALSRDVNVFGGCVYRLDGEVSAVDLGISWSATDQLSATLLLRRLDGEGRVLKYDTDAAELDLTYSF